MGVMGGAILGLIRGLDYRPTVIFAVVEGAVLCGLPAAILGLFVAVCSSFTAAVARHSRYRT